MNINSIIYALAREENLSIASIARLINMSPQNFNNKLKRNSLSLEDFNNIAKALNIDFDVSFKLKNNKTISINDQNIKDDNVLEFCIFCIERLKDELNITGKEAYDMLANKTNILYSYISKNYEVLHTQGEEYIINDLKDVLNKTGVSI